MSHKNVFFFIPRDLLHTEPSQWIWVFAMRGARWIYNRYRKDIRISLLQLQWISFAASVSTPENAHTTVFTSSTLWRRFPDVWLCSSVRLFGISPFPSQWSLAQFYRSRAAFHSSVRFRFNHIEEVFPIVKSKDRATRRITEAFRTRWYTETHDVFLPQVLRAPIRSSPRGIKKCV